MSAADERNHIILNSEPLEILSILEGLRVGVIVIDKAETVRFCNRAAAEFIGTSTGDILNRKIFETIPESELGRVIREGRSQSARLYIKDRLFVTNRAPIVKNGETVGAVAVFQDSSELEELLSRLDNTQSILTSLENIFENAYDGVIVVDRNGIVTRITKAYCRFLNIEQKDALGQYVTKILPTAGCILWPKQGKPKSGKS